MPTTRVLATIAFSLLAVTACGSDDATSSDSLATPDTPMTTDGVDAIDTPGAQASVGLKDSRFDPTEIEITAGDTVTFTNNDPYDHTITSATDSSIEFDSGEISQDATFEQTFDTAGTYAYFCQIHPTMRGTITVS
ncbi:MAG TPA: plastocyanin/azurin family copper-binding protein [Ilumatobacteraceae bacterium]|nr:plastocyanin/azurin family copper-binding protein [Ilumatobacteraceae bacterium]